MSKDSRRKSRRRNKKRKDKKDKKPILKSKAELFPAKILDDGESSDGATIT